MDKGYDSEKINALEREKSRLIWIRLRNKKPKNAIFYATYREFSWKITILSIRSCA